MIVRTLADVAGSEREIRTEHWTSMRLLLEEDGMGFSLHETAIMAGSELPMTYRNHLEAVYCVEGLGEVVDVSSGKTHPIGPGTVYALNDYDSHILKALTPLRLVCVFNPALVGPEVHDESGSYPALSAFAVREESV